VAKTTARKQTSLLIAKVFQAKSQQKIGKKMVLKQMMNMEQEVGSGHHAGGRVHDSGKAVNGSADNGLNLVDILLAPIPCKSNKLNPTRRLTTQRKARGLRCITNRPKSKVNRRLNKRKDKSKASRKRRQLGMVVPKAGPRASQKHANEDKPRMPTQLTSSRTTSMRLMAPRMSKASHPKQPSRPKVKRARTKRAATTLRMFQMPKTRTMRMTNKIMMRKRRSPSKAEGKQRLQQREGSRERDQRKTTKILLTIKMKRKMISKEIVKKERRKQKGIVAMKAMPSLHQQSPPPRTSPSQPLKPPRLIRSQRHRMLLQTKLTQLTPRKACLQALPT